MCISFAFLEAGSGEFSLTGPQTGVPAEGALPQCPDPSAVSSSQGLASFPRSLDVGLQEGQTWALRKRRDEEYFKGKNQIKSFQI